MSPGWRGHGLKPVRHRWDDALSRLDGLAFERLMGRYYEAQGYRVEHVGTGGGRNRYDGGIDLKLHRGDETLVVQCKRHTAYKIPHNDVHQLLGVMRTAGATGAIFLTTGEYTDAALQKCRGVTDIQLIDGVEVRRMLGPMLERLPQSADPVAARWEPVGDPGAIVQGRRESRISYGASRTSKGGTADAGGLWPFVLGIVVLGLLWFGLRELQAKLDEASRPDPARQPSTEARSAARLQTRAASPAVRPTEIAPSAPASQIQWAEPTEADVRETQRRADEAVQILGDRAPEM